MNDTKQDNKIEEGMDNVVADFKHNVRTPLTSILIKTQIIELKIQNNIPLDLEEVLKTASDISYLAKKISGVLAQSEDSEINKSLIDKIFICEV